MPRYSVFTACTPWTSLSLLAPEIRKAGFDGIEIGLRDRVFDPTRPVQYWANNPAMLDWKTAERDARVLAGELQDLGLAVPCLGSYACVGDTEHLNTAFAVARILSCRLIRVRVPAYDRQIPYRALLDRARDGYRALSQRAADEGVTILAEIHDRTICPSTSSMMRLLDGLDPQHVGVIFDPGNGISDGHESLAMAIDLLGPYLRHVHIKNKVLEILPKGREGVRWRPVMAGLDEGLLDWPWLVAELTRRGYDGWWSIENFTGEERGLARLAEDAAWLRRVVG